jgi:hypothetical protein
MHNPDSCRLEERGQRQNDDKNAADGKVGYRPPEPPHVRPPARREAWEQRTPRLSISDQGTDNRPEACADHSAAHRHLEWRAHGSPDEAVDIGQRHGPCGVPPRGLTLLPPGRPRSPSPARPSTRLCPARSSSPGRTWLPPLQYGADQGWSIHELPIRWGPFRLPRDRVCGVAVLGALVEAVLAERRGLTDFPRSWRG